LPQLLRFSEKDMTGATYLTINTLIDKRNERSIIQTYTVRLQHVQAGALSDVSIVILLDTLGRSVAKLSPDDLMRLMRLTSPEVKSAVLYYVRARLRAYPEEREYFEFLRAGLNEAAYQLRLQTLFALSDLKGALRSEDLIVLSACESDSNIDVAMLCRQLRSSDSQLQQKGER